MYCSGEKSGLISAFSSSKIATVSKFSASCKAVSLWLWAMDKLLSIRSVCNSTRDSVNASLGIVSCVFAVERKSS